MKLRLTIWAATIFLLVLIIIQNREFYLSEQTMTLNLLFIRIDNFTIANLTHVLVYLVAGLGLACISLYQERYRLRRQVKQANTAFHSCARQVSELETPDAPQPGNRLRQLLGRFRRRKEPAREVIAVREISNRQDPS